MPTNCATELFTFYPRVHLPRSGQREVRLRRGGLKRLLPIRYCSVLSRHYEFTPYRRCHSGFRCRLCPRHNSPALPTNRAPMPQPGSFLQHRATARLIWPPRWMVSADVIVTDPNPSTSPGPGIAPSRPLARGKSRGSGSISLIEFHTLKTWRWARNQRARLADADAQLAPVQIDAFSGQFQGSRQHFGRQAQTEAGIATDQPPAVPQRRSTNGMQAEMRIAVHPAISFRLQNSRKRTEQRIAVVGGDFYAGDAKKDVQCRIHERLSGYGRYLSISGLGGRRWRYMLTRVSHLRQRHRGSIMLPLPTFP